MNFNIKSLIILTKDEKLEKKDVDTINDELVSNKKIEITRSFNAPKNLLYKAFIEPKYLEKWWGTYHCQKSVCHVDPRVGGQLSIQMTMVSGMNVLLKGEILEMIKNEKIVFTTGTVDENTGEFLVLNKNTVIFYENNGKTDLILNVEMIKAKTEREKAAFHGMVKGWPESLNKLEEYICHL